MKTVLNKYMEVIKYARKKSGISGITIYSIGIDFTPAVFQILCHAVFYKDRQNYRCSKHGNIISFFVLHRRFLSNTVKVCRKISAFLNVSALNRVDMNGNIIYNMYDRLNRMIRTSNSFDNNCFDYMTIHMKAQKICFFPSTA